MKTRLLLLLLVIGLVLTACGPAQELESDVEPALTAVSESEPIDTPTPLPGPTNTKESTEIDIPETTPEMDTAAGEEIAKTEALPADVVLIFHRSGGFAGVDQEWIVYADGRIEMPDGSTKQVDSGQVTALLDTIQSAKFFDLSDSYVPLDTCCDRFTYSITVQMDGQTKTVQTIDDAPKQPEALSEVLSAVNTLLLNTQ